MYIIYIDHVCMCTAWLMGLRRLGKSQSGGGGGQGAEGGACQQAGAPGKAAAEFTAVCRQNFLSFRGGQALSVKAFSSLDEVHPHHEG